MSNNWLLIAILLPIFSGIVLYATRTKNRTFIRIFTFIASLAASIVTFGLLFTNPGEELEIVHFTENFNFALKFDGLGRFFAFIVAFLWPLTVLYAFEYMENDKRQCTFFSFFLMSFGVTLGVTMSGNIFTLYCFYELLTLSTVPLVMHEETTDAVRAAKLYFFISLGGAAFAFLSIIYLVSRNMQVPPTFLTNLFYLFGFFGFGVKAAIFPLHFWLPRAGVAPTPVTALLHAVAVVKSGIFAIIRLTYFGYGVTVLSGTWAQYVAIGFAIFTVFYGATMAVKETHFKRRLAYSTVANLSYILFGVLLLNETGLKAGMLHMAFHAEIKILAFFAAGSFMHHTHRNYIYEIDGVGKKMPFTFGCYLIAALALTGIPPLSGFVSKWALITAAFETGTFVSYLGGATILAAALLTAIYMLTPVRRAFFPDKDQPELPGHVEEAGPLMLVPMCLIAVMILVTGLMSGTIANQIELIVQSIM